MPTTGESPPTPPDRGASDPRRPRRRPTPGTPPTWDLVAGSVTDGPWIAELRAQVLRGDLERLGLYDETRVRERFLRAFRPELTRLIVVDGVPAGSIAVRPEPGEQWIEHFYLATALRGRGIGSAVLARVMRLHGDGRPFRLNVLAGSPALRLYRRAGFVLEHQDGPDLFLVADGTVTGLDPDAGSGSGPAPDPLPAGSPGPRSRSCAPVRDGGRPAGRETAWGGRTGST